MQSDSEKDAELVRRMLELGIREEDLKESFVRSGGHGGQNVNKTSTCVLLVHLPSGVRVKCQTTRHQGQNRALARRLLLDKIASTRAAESRAVQARRELLRRRTRSRSRNAKDRMLANKARQGAKKKSRREPQSD